MNCITDKLFTGANQTRFVVRAHSWVRVRVNHQPYKPNPRERDFRKIRRDLAEKFPQLAVRISHAHHQQCPKHAGRRRQSLPQSPRSMLQCMSGKLSRTKPVSPRIGSVKVIAFSLDSKTILSGSNNRTIKSLDANKALETSTSLGGTRSSGRKFHHGQEVYSLKMVDPLKFFIGG